MDLSIMSNYPAPEPLVMKFLTCPDCRSSIGISNIELNNPYHLISFTCQKNHQKKNYPLKELIKNNRKSKEIFSCPTHDEKILGFCQECKVEVWDNCLYESQHENHKKSLTLFSDMTPPKDEIKKMASDKSKEIERLDKNKKEIVDFLEKMKKKIEEYYERKMYLAQLMKYYCENFTPKKLNLCVVKTLNYLMENIQPEPEENIYLEKMERFFNENLLHSIIGWKCGENCKMSGDDKYAEKTGSDRWDCTLVGKEALKKNSIN